MKQKKKYKEKSNPASRVLSSPRSTVREVASPLSPRPRSGNSLKVNINMHEEAGVVERGGIAIKILFIVHVNRVN